MRRLHAANTHSATIHLAGSLLALIPTLLMACAGIPVDAGPSVQSADAWDTSLLPVRHVDVPFLAMGGMPRDVTGLVSAVVADGDTLFVVDAGSRRILQISLAESKVSSIGALRDASSPGLYASRDGRVYALDPSNRAVVVIDAFTDRSHRVSLNGMVSKPADITLVGEYELAVLDAQDGRVVLVDAVGGPYSDQPIRRPEDSMVSSPRALAYSGGRFLLLDERADDVAGFDRAARRTGIFASDELFGVKALAADSCGRFYVADDDDGTLYIGIPDMSVPGNRVVASDLQGTDVTDLWADGVFLYVATRMSGIFIYLVDPGCD